MAGKAHCTHVAWGGNYVRTEAWYPNESPTLKGIYSEQQLGHLKTALGGAFPKVLVECASPDASTLRKFVSDLRIPVKISRSPVDDVVLLERTALEGVLVLWRDERGALRHLHAEDLSQLAELPPRVLASVEYLAGKRDRVSVPDTSLSLSSRDGWLTVTNEATRSAALSVRASQVAWTYDSEGKPSHLLCVDTALGTLYEVNVRAGDGRTVDVVARELALREGEAVTGIAVTQDGSLLMLSIHEEGDSRLEVLNRASLKRLHVRKGGARALHLDGGGRLLCINDKGDLVAGSTNFAALGLGGYQRGAELTAACRQRAVDFLSALPELDLSEAAVSLSGEPTIMDTITDRYKAALPEVDTLEEVERLKRDLRILREAPPMESLGEVFEPAERLVQERESELLRLQFEDSYKRVRKILQAKQPDTAAVLEGMDGLCELRGRWKILDREQRRDISNRLSQIQSDVDTFLKRNAGHSVAQARDALAQIEKVLVTCSSSEEVNTCFDSPEVRRFVTLAKVVVDSSSRDTLNHAFEKLFQDAGDRLRKPAEGVSAAAVIAARAHMIELRRAIMDRLAQAETREAIEKAASVDLNVLDTLSEQLPENMRRDLLRPIQNALSVKARAIGVREKVVSRGSSGEVRFNGVPFPVYGDFSLTVSPHVREERDGRAGRLVWIDSVGREYHPASGATGLPLDLEDPATKAAVADSREEAVAFFKASPRRVPEPRAHWRMPKHTEEQLGSLAKAFSGQLRRQSGITILMGEAGAGKNVMVDLFAAHTNREVFQFSCNRQTDKEDISYAYLYDPEKGTYKVDSQLLKAVQTPGALVVLDELNTLPPGVLKMFNAPLDERRCFFLPDGRVIKFDPSVILVGCMNPPWYLGTEQLPQEIKSRARFLSIDYPPVGEKGMWRSDEAEMIAAFNDRLKDIPPEKFRAMWNATINKQPLKGLERELTPEIQGELQALSTVVRIAAKAREAYRAYRDGSSADGFDLAVSLRETSDICAELTPGADIVGVVNSVLLNKVHDPVQQGFLRELIEHAL
jgi:MoxR-like ATPase